MEVTSGILYVPGESVGNILPGEAAEQAGGVPPPLEQQTSALLPALPVTCDAHDVRSPQTPA